MHCYLPFITLFLDDNILATKRKKIVEFEITFMERGLTKHYDFFHTQASKQCYNYVALYFIMLKILSVRMDTSIPAAFWAERRVFCFPKYERL